MVAARFSSSFHRRTRIVTLLMQAAIHVVAIGTWLVLFVSAAVFFTVQAAVDTQ